MASITFQRETLAAVRGDELTQLLDAHYVEIAHYKDIPLDVDWPAYEMVEASHALRVYTARAGSRLIGYGAFIARHSVHYSTSFQAMQDVLFLLPEHRKQSIGYRFMFWCDRQLAAEGVQVVMQHSKVAHPMDPVLRRLRYDPIDTIWGKRLDLWVPRPR